MQRRLNDRSSSTAESALRKKEALYVDLTYDKIYLQDDKERLFMELQQIKIENNKLSNENMKLKTHITQIDKDLCRYEKLCCGVMDTKCSDSLLIQLRKHNKELASQLKEKNEQLEHLKRNAKITKVQELECEKRVLQEELQRLKSLYDQVVNQKAQISTAFQQLQSLEPEIRKLSKMNEMYLTDNKIMAQKLQQVEEEHNQFQLVSKVNQAQAEKKIALLQSQNKKLFSEKTNLKVTIKMLQDREKNIIFKKPSCLIKAQGQITQVLLAELRYKLILRGITATQLSEMLDGLKLQAKEQSVQIRLDDFHHILNQEPFSFTDDKKISQMLHCLSGSGESLVEQFKSLIGSYETFNNFDFETEQEKMQKQLKQCEVKIKEFWNNKELADFVEVQKMLQVVGLNFDSPSLLFYNLNLFEKSNENLHQIKTLDTLDPFTDEDEDQLSHLLPKSQPPKISEVSDEEKYDQQSFDQ